jgi:hypothetical protein
METKTKSKVFCFTLFLYLLGGPFMALFLFSFYLGYPNLLDGLYGFIGLVIFIVPLAMATLFGVIPLGLLAALTLWFLTHGVSLRLALLINVACGISLGFLWPYCLHFVLTPSDSTVALFDLTAIGGVIALLFTIFSYQYARAKK